MDPDDHGPHQAMEREAREELTHPPDNTWEYRVRFTCLWAVVHVFRCFSDVHTDSTDPTEPTTYVSPYCLPSACLSNLFWLVPLMLSDHLGRVHVELPGLGDVGRPGWK